MGLLFFLFFCVVLGFLGGSNRVLFSICGLFMVVWFEARREPSRNRFWR